MLCEAGVMKEHRLPSLCAQRSFTPLPCSLKNSGENPRWRTGHRPVFRTCDQTIP